MDRKNLCRLLGQSFLLAVVSFVMMGCDNPQRTVDQLKQEITSFRANPTDEGKQKIESGFGTLDAQIEQLEKKGDSLKADVLREQRNDLASDYTAAQIGKAVNDASEAVKGFGKAFEKAGKAIGDAFNKQEGTTTNNP